jgi:2-iminobutanoate/2-iminopropanoate deaminase
LVGETLEVQTRKTFDNIDILLSEMGKNLNDIAKVTGYVFDDSGDLSGYKSVFSELFSEPYPCQTLVGGNSLSDSEILIELEVEVPR